MSEKRIVIVGGGFGGVKCAQALRRQLSARECEIVLFNTENHMVFHPLLAEVAGASLHPDAASVPLRQMLPSVYCRSEKVLQIDFAASRVEYEGPEGRRHYLPYDQVLLACGRVVNLAAVPGMADHGFPLKTVGDAMLLRSQIINQLEKAEVTADPEQKRWQLSFIVVGGGFSGVETAGEINDFARESSRFYPHISREDISVQLIHSRDLVLPEVSTPLRVFAQERMAGRGIDFILNARVVSAT